MRDCFAKTGGEEQVNEMESDLQSKGLEVTGKAILDPACHLVKVKQLFIRIKSL